MLRKGQALVIVLLILAVIMTVGLSVASRSVTEISTSTTNDESARALAAAEAGIEAQLAGAAAPNFGTSGETSVTTTSSYGAGTEVALNEPLAAGEVGTIFLSDGVNEYTGNKFRLCWGQGANDANAPAIEVMLYYKNGSVYGVARAAYDAQSRGNFAPAVVGGSGCPIGRTYIFYKDINIPSDLSVPSSSTRLFMRVRLFYNGNTKHYVGVKDISTPVANKTFPGQGQVVNSTGQSGVTSRKVQVFQQYPDLGSIFDSAVFSVTNLVK